MSLLGLLPHSPLLWYNLASQSSFYFMFPLSTLMSDVLPKGEIIPNWYFSFWFTSCSMIPSTSTQEEVKKVNLFLTAEQHPFCIYATSFLDTHPKVWRGYGQKIHQWTDPKGQQTFKKRNAQSLTIREMQMMATMRYHLAPVRKSSIRKDSNNECQRAFSGKRNCFTMLGNRCNKQTGEFSSKWAYPMSLDFLSWAYRLRKQTHPSKDIRI